MSATLTRESLLLYLAADPFMHRLALYIGLTEDDTATGYGNVLDDTFAQLGYYEDTDVLELDSSITPIARALARYYALAIVNANLAIRVNTQISNPMARRSDSQMFEQTAKLLDRAKAKVQAYGFVVEQPVAGGELEVGALVLDALVPRDWNTRTEWYNY